MRHVFLLTASFLLATAAVAQVPGVSAGFGVHGNYATLNVEGTLKDVYGPAWGGGAHFDLQLVGFSFRFSADYLSAAPNNDEYQKLIGNLTGSTGAGFSVDGGAITIWSASANAKLPILPLPVIKPYITGGGGLAWLSADEATVTFQGAPYGKIPGSKAQPDWSANAGAGVDLSFGPVTLYGEFRYVWVFADEDNSTYVPFTVGITF